LLAHVGLDLDFGDNGRGLADATLLVSPLSDGKVLAVGKKRVTRLNADGSIDGSFFDAGGAQAALGKMDWVAGDAVVSGDRLYVAGVLKPREFSDLFSGNVVFVRALNLTDGSVVDSFGEHGFMTTVIGSLAPGAAVYSVTTPFLDATADGGFAFAVAQRNRTAANVQNGAVTLYRVNARGRFNFSFGGGDGEVVVEQGRESNIRRVQVDSQGRILAVHTLGRFSGTLSRFRADGSLDETFGEGGATNLQGHITFPGYDGFTLAPDDSPLLVIMADDDLGVTGLLVRYAPDGTGRESHSMGRSNSVSVQVTLPAFSADGHVAVTVGDKLARLTGDLEFDPAFGKDGLAPLPTGFFGGRTAFDATGAILVGNGEGVSRYVLDASPVQLGADGILRVEGNDDANVLTAAVVGQSLNVTFDGEAFTFAAANVAGILVTSREGGDRITLTVDVPSTVTAGDGSDTIRITGSGDDSVSSGEGRDFIDTGDGDDHIIAIERATILSGSGDDVIGTPDFTFTDPILEVDAGDGNDKIYVNRGAATIWGGDGDDLIQDGFGYSVGADRLNGEAGDDTIIGGNGVDIITSGPGIDVIDAAGGMNTVDGLTTLGADLQEQGFCYADGVFSYIGGSGRDSVQIVADQSGRGALTRHIIGSQADTFRATINLSVIRLIEIVGGDGDDELYIFDITIPAIIDGGRGDDDLTGGGGNDALNGGDGNDSLYGPAGNDIMRGEAGDDYFEGGKGDDMLLGQGGAHQLFGLDGNDTLFSHDGAADTVRGGAGIDRSDGDEADDVLSVEILT
jgi:Ca2+-binding RTX toxin-like protein